MDSDKETGPTLKWENCPVELLCLIFKKLNTDSLVKCMYICRSWNSTALYIAEKKNLWEKIVNKLLVDNFEMVKMKSIDILSWKDLFINSILWSHSDKAELLVLNAYEMSAVNHVHVYRDNLIIVTSSCVKYFNLTKSEFERDINMECIDFFENDNIILKVTSSSTNSYCKTLHLYGKKNINHFDISESNERIVDNVIQYRLDKKGCYVFDNRALLTLHKTKDFYWNVEFLARYYGSATECCGLHIYKAKPYILLKRCQIYYANGLGGFEKVLNVYFIKDHVKGVQNGSSYVEMFHNFGIIYGVEASEKFSFIRKCVDYSHHRVFVMQCPDLTCATEHGEMLFLGYSDGKIDFFMPREKNENAALKRQYNITEAIDQNSYDNCIISIDVYEERHQHHVFVATHAQVYHLLLTHTNIDDYLLVECIS